MKDSEFLREVAAIMDESKNFRAHRLRTIANQLDADAATVRELTNQAAETLTGLLTQRAQFPPACEEYKCQSAAQWRITIASRSGDGLVVRMKACSLHLGYHVVTAKELGEKYSVDRI